MHFLNLRQSQTTHLLKIQSTLSFRAIFLYNTWNRTRLVINVMIINPFIIQFTWHDCIISNQVLMAISIRWVPPGGAESQRAATPVGRWFIARGASKVSNKTRILCIICLEIFFSFFSPRSSIEVNKSNNGKYTHLEPAYCFKTPVQERSFKLFFGVYSLC